MMRYCPLASVTTVRTFSISAGLEASTVAPGSTACDVSLTMPAIDAWAKTAVGHNRASAHTTTICALLRLSYTSVDRRALKARPAVFGRSTPGHYGCRAALYGPPPPRNRTAL